MKKLILFSFCCLLGFASCNDDDDCTTTDNPVCQESVPTNELCQAAFQTWFFNPDTRICEQIGYSGCSPKGFATKEECEACDCE